MAVTVAGLTLEAQTWVIEAITDRDMFIASPAGSPEALAVACRLWLTALDDDQRTAAVAAYNTR